MPRGILAKLILFLACLSLAVGVAPAKRTIPVQVPGNQTTYIGTRTHDQDVFLGIPYAQPPVENLRFRRPSPITPGPTVNAQNYGPRCLQSSIANDTSEDCLTLNIWRPQNATKLPVMLWIYGGSFILGESQTYPGSGIVAASVLAGNPVIYVSFNYRLGFFGFPIGEQAANKNSMNLGLYDQRLAIEWVQQNIEYFGGDPQKVTLFGESAGATSVGYQMLYRGGQIDGAFWAGIMQSAAPASYKSTSQFTPARQALYDHIASQAGCNNVPDSLECLRALDVNTLQNVHVGTYTLPPGLIARANYPSIYGPVTDLRDDFLPKASSILVKSGKYANISMISGSSLDEGTWFVNDPETPADIVSFLATSLPAQAYALNPSATKELLRYYPDSLAAGSPYRTGNEIFGRAREYKRAASLVGDLVFTAPRRHFIQNAVSQNQRVWSYRFAQPTTEPAVYGVSHSLEIPYVFNTLPADTSAGDVELSDRMIRYWINFAYFSNPRPAGSDLSGACDSRMYALLWLIEAAEWPSYGSGKKMLQLQTRNYTVIRDTFREPANKFIIGNPSLFA
ncbi:hypothetical protein FRC12_000922 [Ceratobasidium sp. 428]|nr:hypothetical protein FRC12_000922 [Ceratobasidium sp. 428]